MPKYSTQYPKQWEAFQRCGAAKLISIEEKFDPEKAEKLFYTHLISKQKIDESLFKSNQHTKPINWVRYESKNNNNVTPYVKDLLDEDDTTTEDKMVLTILEMLIFVKFFQNSSRQLRVCGISNGGVDNRS